MDHPNIARVYDAGATATGRPYFVMELVRGVKITDFCDENKVSTQERLKLFIQVCQAIQHAHQKGIIHRDIKPSNILVTINDGVPVPKVIDFGIAKATQGRLTDQTLFTAFEQFLGTPAYMSPEQTVMTSLDIDTRSDIYSLGVLLYELLTSKTPFEQKELLAAGLDEMRRTIREKEPPKPSTRLTQELVLKSESRKPKSEGEIRADSRRLLQEKKELIHFVRGDLDWIVMKCLEKDRARRYETASGLARDIQRHLNHEPVTARPPSRLYEFRKTVRRHRVGFAATAAVIVALAIGLVASSLELASVRRAEAQARAAQISEGQQRDKAQTEEQKAKTEAAKSQQVARFLEDMLQSVGPSVAVGRDTKLLREILDKTAERVGLELKGQQDVEAELSYTLGEVYFDLGEFPKAELMHRHALELRKGLPGEDTPLVALSNSHLGRVLLGQRKFIEAEELLRQALVVQRKTPGQDQRDTLFTLTELSVALNAQGGADRRKEAEALLRESLESGQKLFGEESLEVAGTLEHLGVVLRVEGRSEEAVNAFSRALGIRRKSPGDQIGFAGSLELLATALVIQNKLEDAERLRREALAMRKRLFGDNHPSVATALSNLTSVLKRENKLAEVEYLYREELAASEKLGSNESPGFATALYDLAGVCRDQGKLSEAESLFRESLAMRRKLFKNEDKDVASSLESLANLLLDRNPAEAESLLREAVAVRRGVAPNDTLGLNWTLSYLGNALMAEGKLAEAESDQREALALALKDFKQRPSQVAWSIDHLFEVLKREGKVAETLQILDTVETRVETNGPLNVALMQALGNYYARVGQWHKAAVVFAKLVEFEPANRGYYHSLAPLLAQQEDLDGYRRCCGQILSQFSAANSPQDCERMAKDCLFFQCPGVDLAAAAKLADSAVTRGQGDGYLAFFQFAQGLADYRTGKFSNAVDSMAKVITVGGWPFREAEANAVLAMAEQRLDHKEEARAALSHGTKIFSGMAAPESGDLGAIWNDWIIANSLIKEAKALVEDQPPPASGHSSPPTASSKPD
jgi:tetratricopeptide (TPR) repeat protein